MNIRFTIMKILTSNKYLEGQQMREEQSGVLIRYALLNSMLFLGITLCLVFGYENLQEGVFRIDLFGMSALLALNFVLLRSKLPFMLPALLSVLPFFVLIIVIIMTDTTQGSGFSWVFVFPIITIFLLGLKGGVILSALLLTVLGVLLFMPHITGTTFSPTFITRVISVYLFSLVLSVMNEVTRDEKDTWLARLTKKLQSEHDEMLAMKDNLETGIFILNERWLIQPYYSRALETILEQSALSGTDFISLLEHSISKKECETLADYFEMVVKKTFDRKMLEDINPLHLFTYTSLNGSEKSLKTTFTPLERPDGSTCLLCTLEDHSHEVKLEQQLSEEDQHRQEEMKSFFEVVHIDPSVLNDFIEETDSEFEHINVLLKNKNLPAKTVMTEMYQSTHAIKSNAIIVGLNSFAEKTHKLEDSIRKFSNNDEVSFQDVLHVMLELDSIMKINDNLRNIIEKIQLFSQNEQRLQSSQVLTQTLERAIERVGEDTGKQAKLVTQQLDLQDVSSSQRRLIKEILVQLIRNAMYHGIETPDVRAAYKKDACGTIILSIDVNKKQKKIRIRLTDNGAGIDFKSIQLRAKDNKLLSDTEKLSDKNALAKVLFMTGFSTASDTNFHAGRGVGLSLVHSRVKEAGGTIQLQTEENNGTSFTIELPYDIGIL